MSHRLTQFKKYSHTDTHTHTSCEQKVEDTHRVRKECERETERKAKMFGITHKNGETSQQQCQAMQCDAMQSKV